MCPFIHFHCDLSFEHDCISRSKLLKVSIWTLCSPENRLRIIDMRRSLLLVSHEVTTVIFIHRCVMYNFKPYHQRKLASKSKVSISREGWFSHATIVTVEYKAIYIYIYIIYMYIYLYIYIVKPGPIWAGLSERWWTQELVENGVYFQSGNEPCNKVYTI